MATVTANSEALKQASAALRRWSRTLSPRLVAMAPEASRLLLEASRAAINKKTGKTAQTLRVTATQGGGMLLLELHGDKVAFFLASGTAPHPIDPVRARALRFVSKSGETVFAAHVHQHPGTRPYPWRQKALGLAKPAITGLGLSMVRVALDNLAKDIKGVAA